MQIFFFIVVVINLLVLVFVLRFIAIRGGVNFIKNLLSKKIINSSDYFPETATKKIEEFSKYKSTKDDVVFLGDSIFRGGQWGEYFPGLSCRNRGISGQKTLDILNRVELIAVNHPKKIFLLVGINDILDDNSIETLSVNYRKILEAIKSTSPNTEVFPLSILPVNEQKCQDILLKKVTNKIIIEANKHIKSLCEEFEMVYVDCSPHLQNGNHEMNEEFTIDGIHLYVDGYLKLKNCIEPYVQEQLVYQKLG